MSIQIQKWIKKFHQIFEIFFYFWIFDPIFSFFEPACVITYIRLLND